MSTNEKFPGGIRLDFNLSVTLDYHCSVLVHIFWISMFLHIKMVGTCCQVCTSNVKQDCTFHKLENRVVEEVKARGIVRFMLTYAPDKTRKVFWAISSKFFCVLSLENAMNSFIFVGT